MAVINIPVGISDFEKIRRNGYYYVDKTGLILELLKGEAAEDRCDEVFCYGISFYKKRCVIKKKE